METLVCEYRTLNTEHRTLLKDIQKMPKILSLVGLIISALVFLVFLLDLVAKIPFGRENATMSLCFILASGALGYISWSAWREVA